MDTGAYLHSVFGLEGKTILVTGAARRPSGGKPWDYDTRY